MKLRRLSSIVLAVIVVVGLSLTSFAGMGNIEPPDGPMLPAGPGNSSGTDDSPTDFPEPAPLAGTTTIADAIVPLASLPSLTTIMDGDVPLGNLPNTGNSASSDAIGIIGMGAVIVGVYFLSKKKG